MKNVDAISIGRALQISHAGYDQAQFNLALAHFRGQGTVPNPVLAFMWMDIPARGGHAQAAILRDKIGASLSAAALARAQQLEQACVARQLRLCE